MEHTLNTARTAARFVFLLVFAAAVSLEAMGEIVFSDLNLSGDDGLLFRAANVTADSVQDALFLTRLPGDDLKQLTVFPEKMDLLEGGRILQIRNAFGTLRVALSGGLPALVPGLPSFAGGNYGVPGRTEETASSPDGRWQLYLDPVTAAQGNLMLVDVLSGTKIQAAARLERPEKKIPALWSPDSRSFLYERAGKLYYYTAGSSPMAVDENLRLIGEGSINSVSWGTGGDFFYIQGSTLYRVRGTELFARTLYAGFLQIGAVAGEIPFEFDPGFDRFWVAPDARSILVSKGRRGLFYYPLADSSAEAVLPYLLLPRSHVDINVLWPAGGALTVLVTLPDSAGPRLNVWRLNLSTARGFERLPPPDAGTRGASFTSASLSPDGKTALFWGAGGIVLYDYVNWKLLEIAGSRPAGDCLWNGNNEFIAGDDLKIERIALAPGTSRIQKRNLVCLSRAPGAAFEEGTSRVLAESGGAWFATDGKSPWTLISGGTPRRKAVSLVSARHRVYLEARSSGPYANLPMVRKIDSTGTFSLFPPPETPGFSHTGSGPREAALCFDLYDDDQGLPETLDALARFGIKATFFLNGEFIRRHPEAVKEIADGGHEAASMFFALIDCSDARYRAGADFIPRGLARNEDEFHRVTGKELALLWHPPWYITSPEITAAAAKAGYTSADRDIDPLDWVRRDDEKSLGLVRRSPSEIVDRVVETVKPGDIIPVRLGLLSGGGRSGYLFSRINVLIGALIGEGYNLTTVSEILNTRLPR